MNEGTTLTSEPRAQVRVALVGLPGVGKSTASRVLLQLFAERGVHAEVIRLAKPLYDVQAFFYARCHQSLKPGQQDGELLNFLGEHFRKVSPNSLLNDFAARVRHRCDLIEAVICDDARPLDVEGLRSNGFTIVRVTADERVRVTRKAGRGDARPGRDDHVTERAVEPWVADHVIDNGSSLEALQQRLLTVVDEVTPRGGTQPRAAQPLDRRLRHLVGAAIELIEARYQPSRHQVAAAIMDANERVFLGLHVEAMVGRASVCAEAAALARAIQEGATSLAAMVAVRHPKPGEDRFVEVVPPCGLCRELLLDYAPHICVVISTVTGLSASSLRDLLPYKYVGTKW